MVRKLYGGSPADVLQQVTADDGDLAPATGTVTCWTAASGGTQLSVFTTATGGSASTTVTVAALGRISFYGPDGYTSAIYVQDSAGNRWRIDPADLADRVGGAMSVSVNGGTPINPTNGNVDLAIAVLTADDVRDIIAAYLPDNDYYPDQTYSAGDPVPSGYPNGTKYFALDAGPGQPVFTQLAAEAKTTDATSFTTVNLPAATPATTFYFLWVHAGITAPNATYPTTVTGGGTTWTAVPNCSRINGAGAGASRVYVSTGAPTGGVVTIGFGSTTVNNLNYRVVQVDNLNAAAPVKQANAMTFVNQTPGVPLTGVDPANPMLGFYHAQSGGQSAAIGDGYTQLGTQIASSTDAPVFLTDAEYRLDGVGLVDWAAGSTAQKILCALELDAA